LIGKDLYRAITIIRRVRNDAAHSPATFSLTNQSDCLHKAYEAIVTPGNSVDHAARQFMKLRLVEVRREVDRQRGDNTKTYQAEDLDRMLERPEIAQHSPKCQLAVAVSLICALIVSHKIELLAVLREGALLAQILQPQEHSAKSTGEQSG